jgi:hypothetical protein
MELLKTVLSESSSVANLKKGLIRGTFGKTIFCVSSKLGVMIRL